MCGLFNRTGTLENLRCQKETTLLRGLELMIDLFKVIYGWWALHLFSMLFFFSSDLRLGDFSTPVWPSRNSPRWPGRGYTHTCDGEVCVIRSLGFSLVHSQVMLTSFFKVLLPEIYSIPWWLMSADGWLWTQHGHPWPSVQEYSHFFSASEFVRALEVVGLVRLENAIVDGVLSMSLKHILRYILDNGWIFLK